jgi:hypothetical protein
MSARFSFCFPLSASLCDHATVAKAVRGAYYLQKSVAIK